MPARLRPLFATLSFMVFLASLGVYSYLLSAQGDSGTPTSPVHLLLWATALFVLLGAFLPWRSWRLALLATATVASGILGILSGFSIGLLVLLGTIFAMVSYLAELTWSPVQVRRAALSTVAGGATGLALIAATFVPSMFPHVECRPTGAGFSPGWGFFGGGTDSSGHMSGNANDSTITGSGESNGRTYHFTCRDGRLVEFTQR